MLSDGRHIEYMLAENFNFKENGGKAVLRDAVSNAMHSNTLPMHLVFAVDISCQSQIVTNLTRFSDIESKHVIIQIFLVMSC